jgi:hypothetical protein
VRGAIFWKAAAVLVTEWRGITRAVGPPAGFVITFYFVVSLAGVRSIPLFQLLSGLVESACFCLSAVRVHRLVILGRVTAIQWKIREWRFAGYSLLIVFVFGALAAVGGLLVAFALGPSSPAAPPLAILAALAAAYPASRLSFLLPAAATDTPLSVSDAYHAARHLQAPLYAIFVLVPLFFELLTYPVAVVPPGLVSSAMYGLLGILAGAYGVAALSVTYLQSRVVGDGA